MGTSATLGCKLWGANRSVYVFDRRLLLGGMQSLSANARDLLLRALRRPREILPDVELAFPDPRPSYDANREVVSFFGHALRRSVRCAVSREALEDYFGADGRDKDGRLASIYSNQSRIEQLVRTKYLSWPVEEPDAVLLTTSDVEKLS